ncbi:MAG: cobalamin-dependent protein [Thermoleophilia bacterium]|nr:cobalamin-dependent protein [Thermoleophilia bacterium]
MATTEESKKRLRVLLAHCDQDAHDRGVRYIAEVLQEGGMEVIFIRYRVCEEVVRVAVQEDVDAVGLSFYSSGYSHDIPAVLESLKEKEKDVKLLVGGIIPSDEIDGLLALGVSGIFGPNSRRDEVLECLAS